MPASIAVPQRRDPGWLDAPGICVGETSFHWELRPFDKVLLLFLVHDETGEAHDVVASSGMHGGSIVRRDESEEVHASGAAAGLSARIVVGEFSYQVHHRRSFQLALGHAVRDRDTVNPADHLASATPANLAEALKDTKTMGFDGYSPARFVGLVDGAP